MGHHTQPLHHINLNKTAQICLKPPIFTTSGAHLSHLGLIHHILGPISPILGPICSVLGLCSFQGAVTLRAGNIELQKPRKLPKRPQNLCPLPSFTETPQIWGKFHSLGSFSLNFGVIWGRFSLILGSNPSFLGSFPINFGVKSLILGGIPLIMGLNWSFLGSFPFNFGGSL